MRKQQTQQLDIGRSLKTPKKLKNDQKVCYCKRGIKKDDSEERGHVPQRVEKIT